MQKVGLFFVESGVLVECLPEGVFSHFKVIFDHAEGILKPIFQYLHLFFDDDELFFGLSIGSSGCSDFVLYIRLCNSSSTIRFFIGN